MRRGNRNRGDVLQRELLAGLEIQIGTPDPDRRAAPPPPPPPAFAEPSLPTTGTSGWAGPSSRSARSPLPPWLSWVTELQQDSDREVQHLCSEKK